MDEDKNINGKKEVLKLDKNEVITLLPTTFDAGFQYSEFIIGQLKEFCFLKGYPLDHLDIVHKLSYDLNLSAINHSMKSTGYLTVYEKDGKFTALFETSSRLYNG